MRSVLAVGSALASWLALAGAAQAEPLPPCDSTVTTGCVVSVKLDGVGQDYPGTGAPYELSVEALDPGLPWDVNVIVRGEDGAPLPYDGEWEIALNLGGVDPGETFSRGRDVTVVRGGTPASRTITVTLKPVRMAEGPCSSSGVCPALATLLRAGYLKVWIGDLDYLSSPADRAAMRASTWRRTPNGSPRRSSSTTRRGRSSSTWRTRTGSRWAWTCSSGRRSSVSPSRC